MSDHPKHYKTLNLLVIPPRDKPVYFVVEGIAAVGDPPGEGKDYFYEEHSCPTNYVECEAIIYEGDEDPHGVFQFVRAVAAPDDGPDLGEWRDIFPEAFR